MYTAGEVEIVVPCGHEPAKECVESGYCDVTDLRRAFWDGQRYATPQAYLPHSCDEWVIGGPDEIRALIADLQAALAKLEATE